VILFRHVYEESKQELKEKGKPKLGYPMSQGLHSNAGLIVYVSRTVATRLLTGRVVNTYLLFVYSVMTSNMETRSRKGYKTLKLSLSLFSCPSELFFFYMKVEVRDYVFRARKRVISNFHTSFILIIIL